LHGLEIGEFGAIGEKDQLIFKRHDGLQSEDNFYTALGI
jgi:hypothetical protein